jgi:hypothetical protein
MKMPDIFHETEEAVFGHLHHHAVPLAEGGNADDVITTRTPATQPVNLAATPVAAPSKENTMSPLSTLEDDVKADLTDGLNWLDGFVTRVKAAAPGIIATSEAVGSSTVGKLVELAAGKILPPGVEEEFLALAGRYFGSFGQVAALAPAAPVAAPVDPQQPAAPVPAQ